jgi:hypothetical protein
VADGRTPRCRPIHDVDGHVARPLGSAFKLYVAGALAHQFQAGRAAWDEPLAIRDDRKSLPSGVLQDLPAGTSLPLRTYAEYMISISDNTATDHLIHRLGRRTVERQQARFGMRDPRRNMPLPTTREFFTLKITEYPVLLNRYVRLPAPLRRAYLAAVVDRLPLPTLDDAADWTGPRAVDTVEWFGSPADICRAFAGLYRQARTPGLEPVARVLSRNDGDLWLDPERWSTTWYKDGAEPGVLTLNYLARTGTGQPFVVSAMVSDPADPLALDAVVPELHALIRGAFALASGRPATPLARYATAVSCSDAGASVHVVVPPSWRAEFTSPTRLNACGVLPRCRPVAGSYSSASSPTSLRRSSICSNSARASAVRPMPCSASTSQYVQATNAPSVPGSPSTLSSCCWW